MPIEVMYKLVHASKSVRDINSLSSTNLNYVEVSSDSLTIDNYLYYQNSDAVIPSTLLRISNIEDSYTATPQQSMFIQQFDTESANLNKISTYNTALAITNLNTQDALRNAKQDR